MECVCNNIKFCTLQLLKGKLAASGTFNSQLTVTGKQPIKCHKIAGKDVLQKTFHEGHGRPWKTS